MKAKLIKLEDGKYDLLIESNLEELKNTKLSLKNCQAIELGYDLKQLAGEYANKELNVELTSKAGNFYGFSSSFKDGFEKALELMGDKKFSEKDLEKSIIWAHDKSTEGVYLSRLPITDFIQSIQQTEWEVTFNPEELDADGCLILKLKSE